ncbi:MAG: PD-(D/E)XK nuclease family protein [Coriobacteriales bacterium]|nr:PD-(D/E)XK nuclease family protein [Coriobacteriales bacterium]
MQCLKPWRDAREARFSPSQIENYLDCPQYWFLGRMGVSDSLDALLDARSRGDLMHATLRSFYQRLEVETGRKRVDEDIQAQASMLLEDCFERALDEQRELDDALLAALISGKPDTRNGNHYVPISRAERNDAKRLLRELQSLISCDATFLPGYQPTHLEFELGAADPLTYAGYRIKGTIDRVDVDADGHAVVIDYKGGLSNHESLPTLDDDGLIVMPKKIQTLIYAQLLRRKTELTPVAAIYRSYRRPHPMKGCYDPRVLGAPELGIDEHAARGMALIGMSFEDALDRVEEQVALMLDRLMSGDIQPQPRSEASCRYCPAWACPKRREGWR